MSQEPFIASNELPRGTGGFDLIYLDPMICNADLRPPWSSWIPADYPQRRQVSKFWTTLISALRIDAEKDKPANFLDPGGLGSRLKDDRQLQVEASRIVDSLVLNLPAERKSNKVSTVLSNGSGIESLADKPHGGSLFVFDAMLSTRASAPQALALTLPDVTQFEHEMTREIEAVLFDTVPVVALYEDSALGLLVNKRAFYHWTAPFTKVLSEGWYPWTRVIGLLKTASGRRPYLDVAAILVRPTPSVTEIFSLHVDDSWAARLREIRKNHLEQKIKQLDAANGVPTGDKSSGTDEKSNNAAPDPATPGQDDTAAVPPKPTSSVSDPSDATPPTGKPVNGPKTEEESESTVQGKKTISFSEYREYWIPIAEFGLACRLNGVSAKYLDFRAKEVENIVIEYLVDFKKLDKYRDEQSQQIVLPTDVKKLLPELSFQ